MRSGSRSNAALRLRSWKALTLTGRDRQVADSIPPSDPKRRFGCPGVDESTTRVQRIDAHRLAKGEPVLQIARISASSMFRRVRKQERRLNITCRWGGSKGPNRTALWCGNEVYRHIIMSVIVRIHWVATRLLPILCDSLSLALIRQPVRRAGLTGQRSTLLE
jgi:hypothetical protein